MKNTFRILVTAMAGVLLFSSCKKQLNLSPTDVIQEKDAFTSITDLQNTLNSAYARYDGENTSYINTVLSDESILGRDWAGQGQFMNRFQYGSDATTGGEVTQGWNTNYSMIQACNLVLDNYDKIPALNAADTAKKVSIKAQAIALRALGHFELMERYAKAYSPSNLGVPITIHYISPTLRPMPPRNTSDEVITFVQSELKTASGLMPVATAANFTDVTMNRLNITGLQARVALYKGDWQKALDSSAILTASPIRPLDPANFAGIWTDAALNSEVLFRTKRNTAASSVDVLYIATTNAIYFAPSSKLRAMYGAGDVRPAQYFGSIYINKYFASAALGGRVNDLKGMRISEMFLIHAEAATEVTGINAGVADLNALRSARGATTLAPAPFATKADAIQYIMDERARELAFEGFRFFDLKRRNMNVDRILADVTSPAWLTLPAGNFRFTLPIPVGEIQSNNNMVQNPNY